jgi:hypothetical protein
LKNFFIQYLLIFASSVCIINENQFETMFWMVIKLMWTVRWKPLIWISKRQNDWKTNSAGSNFIALWLYPSFELQKAFQFFCYWKFQLQRWTMECSKFDWWWMRFFKIQGFLETANYSDQISSFLIWPLALFNCFQKSGFFVNLEFKLFFRRFAF